MMGQKVALWKELERFSVVHHEQENTLYLGTDMPLLFRLIRERTKAEQPHVIASIFMRHIAIVFTAQLYILSKYRLKWTVTC